MKITLLKAVGVNQNIVYTPEALQSMAESTIGMKVTMYGEEIGEVVGTEIDGDTLVADVKMDERMEVRLEAFMKGGK